MKSHGINMSVKTYLKQKDGGKILVGELSKLNEQNKIIIENLDGTDKVVFPMKSFVSNFLCKYVRNMFDGFVYHNAPVSSYGKFADGTTNFSGGDYGLVSIAAQNTTGIQVGFDPAGTPVVDSRDYNLAGLINHGNGSGQLSKNTMQGTELGLDSFGSTESEFVIQRNFMNNSGADIVINECGFFTNYASSWNATNSAYFTPNRSVLMARDVFSPITVPAGGGKRVRYVIKLDNTAGLGFNNNFLHTLRYNLSNSSGSGDFVKNISGTVNDVVAFGPNETPSTGTPNAVGYEGFIYSGLALNTGDTAFLLTDYASTGIIQHGSTSGKLYYNVAVNYNYQDYDASETIWKNTREFQNNSGAPITVKSWMLNSTTSSVGTYSYLIARGLINSGAGVTIPDGDNLIVEITISVDTGV